MAPKFVAPYQRSGKRGKNDANDAAAICEAVTRPNMRFVPVKTIDQRAHLFIHRARQGYIEERTAQPRPTLNWWSVPPMLGPAGEEVDPLRTVDAT